MTPAERDTLVAVAHAHAEAEGAGDLDATMATLDPVPRYELLPLGVELVGHAVIRRYYEHFFASFASRVAGYRLRSEWVTDEGLGQEYTMFVEGLDGPVRHDVIGILTFGSGGRLSGERIYAGDALFATMVGPVLAEAVPLSAS